MFGIFGFTGLGCFRVLGVSQGFLLLQLFGFLRGFVFHFFGFLRVFVFSTFWIS